MDSNKNITIKYGMKNDFQQLINRKSKKCTDTLFGSTDNNTPLIQYPCASATSMDWQFQYQSDGSYYIVNRKSNKYLTVGYNTFDWFEPYITSYPDARAKWQVIPASGYIKIKNQYSGKCLDLRMGDTANWTRLIQYTCTNADSMNWIFTKSISPVFSLPI